uniref:Uncharacterized protein n=1 Tax=Anguilla anguilla TaxID=7936 RepID=A0A0E9T1G0_ANGAN
MRWRETLGFTHQTYSAKQPSTSLFK